VQARLRNLIDFHKKLKDLKEAGENIVFLPHEQLGLWKIYEKRIQAESLSSSWVRGSGPT
jgi:hypothetical protein